MKKKKNRKKICKCPTAKKMSQVSSSFKSYVDVCVNSNNSSSISTNVSPSVQDIMSLLKDQSCLISNLQKTISSLQDTINILTQLQCQMTGFHLTSNRTTMAETKNYKSSQSQIIGLVKTLW